MMQVTSCVYIEKDDKYLMLLRNKKENDPNKNKWIRIGGKKKANESIYECALREVKEETNLDLTSLKLKGEVFFNGDYQELMYIFTSSEFKGDLGECNEGELNWIKKEAILDLNLWEGDKEFLKLLDNEEFFKLELIYKGEKLTKVIRREEDYEFTNK